MLDTIVRSSNARNDLCVPWVNLRRCVKDAFNRKGKAEIDLIEADLVRKVVLSQQIEL